MRDRIRVFIERLLPWFDPAAREREHRATRRVIAAADEVITSPERDRILRGYRSYGDGFRR